jgi:hypothetical protein
MADSLGTTYKKAIMVVMNTDGSIADSDKIEYSYLASELSGCEEYYSISKLQVFPNPASDFITILDDSGEYTFDIINIAGVEVISNQKVIDGKPIIIKDLKKGLYFIKLNTAKGIKYAKFIKN